MAESTTITKKSLEQPLLKGLTPDEEEATVKKFRYDALVEQNKAISDHYRLGEGLFRFGVHVAGMQNKGLGSYTAEKMGGYFGLTYTDDLDNWMLQHYDIFKEFRRIEKDMKFDPRQMCTMKHDHKGCKHFSRRHGKSIETYAVLSKLHQSTQQKDWQGVLTKANLDNGDTAETLGHIPSTLQDYPDYSFPALLLGRLTYQLKNSADGKGVFTGSPYPNSRVLVFDGEIDMEDIFRAHRMYGYWKASPHRNNSDKKHKFSRKIAKRASFCNSYQTLEEADLEESVFPSLWKPDQIVEEADTGAPQVPHHSECPSEKIALEQSCVHAADALTDMVTGKLNPTLQANDSRSTSTSLASAGEVIEGKSNKVLASTAGQAMKEAQDEAKARETASADSRKRVRSESPGPEPSTSTSTSTVRASKSARRTMPGAWDNEDLMDSDIN